MLNILRMRLPSSLLGANASKRFDNGGDQYPAAGLDGCQMAKAAELIPVSDYSAFTQSGMATSASILKCTSLAQSLFFPIATTARNM